MNLVITGALGHIGSAVIHSIGASAYNNVVIVDNLYTQRYCSLFNLPPGVRFRFVHADIRTADLSSLFANAGVVLHLAALTNAEESLAAAAEFDAVNRNGTARIAEACLRVGARLVFASTTSVYGPQASAVDEDCPAADLSPQSPYARSKLEAEHLLGECGNRGLRYATVRLGTVFGTSPGMRFHTAINKFCWQAVIGQPLSVWRTALHQRRPYLYVGDAVRAFDFIIGNKLFDNRVYNVVTVNATVHNVIQSIRHEVGGVNVEFVDTPIMNQMSYGVSPARLERAGFRCAGDLRRGIRETIRLIGRLYAGRAREQRRSPYAAHVPPRVRPRHVRAYCG